MCLNFTVYTHPTINTAPATLHPGSLKLMVPHSALKECRGPAQWAPLNIPPCLEILISSSLQVNLCTCTPGNMECCAALDQPCKIRSTVWGADLHTSRCTIDVGSGAGVDLQEREMLANLTTISVTAWCASLFFWVYTPKPLHAGRVQQIAKLENGAKKRCRPQSAGSTQSRQQHPRACVPFVTPALLKIEKEHHVEKDCRLIFGG